MNTKNDKQVIARFDEAISTLIERKSILNVESYCTKFGFNAADITSTIANGETTNFHFDWLTPLIIDYGVSSLWLLTGLGEMFMPMYKPDEKAA